MKINLKGEGRQNRSLWQRIKILPWLRSIPLLTSIAIEPTNDCNLNCSFCYRKKRKIGYMDMELFKRIIAQLPSYMRVGLSYGGESIMHPDFPYMVKLCQQKHFRDLNVYSNGILPYPKGIRVVCLPKPPPYIFTDDFKFRDGCPNIKPKADYCRHLYNYIAILWNGDVTLCCHDIAGRKAIGNIAQFDYNVAKAWKSETYRQLRKKGFCVDCDLYRYGF